jgi:hypothetical protein
MARKIPESDFGWTKSSQKMLKPLKMVLCFSCEAVSLKKKFLNFQGLQFITACRMSLTLPPQFKWLEYTYKGKRKKKL